MDSSLLRTYSSQEELLARYEAYRVRVSSTRAIKPITKAMSALMILMVTSIWIMLKLLEI
jgi:hypothetical protein